MRDGENELMEVLIAVLGGLVPTVVYVSFIWWLDRYEKEPVRLLVLAFAWGAIPAAVISIVVEVIVDAGIVAVAGDGLLGTLATASISAPLVEETAKGVALAALFLFLRRELDNVLDGIVYGAMIGFGFALTENVFAYFLPILSAEGINAGLANILMRTVVFGFNHAFWTGITGAALGYARLAPSLGYRLLVPPAGWLAAVTLHGMHNAGATLAEQTLCLSLGISLLIHWGGLFLLLAVAYLTWRKESRWIERGLIEEVRRGAITDQELRLLQSAAARQRVRLHAWRAGGHAASRLVVHYFQSATELAFTKAHLRLLGDEGGNLAEIERLRETVATTRAAAWPWLWPEAS
ncbi:MAG: PrsW family intramembrane metalloprotease [Anaerolineae bacterium]|nr:PrsW family intramembrane metalloprotease [Anaerolineae bacterium]